MKISSRLALAALALVLTALASVQKPAEALPICDSMAGRGCAVPGRVVRCMYLDGHQGACFCEDDHTWLC